MRQAGYGGRVRQFQCLIQANSNAKEPCYGIAERMNADNVFPSRMLANMLPDADPFKKIDVSELLISFFSKQKCFLLLLCTYVIIL